MLDGSHSAVACAAFAVMGTSAQTAHATNTALRYVALGDSYSAASGVLPPDPTAPPQCLRSISKLPARDRREDSARSSPT